MFAGEAGPGVQKAMEIVVALGQIYGAVDLVPVASVQVSGVSYKNLGDAGLEFLQEWAAQGAQAVPPHSTQQAWTVIGARWGYGELPERRSCRLRGAGHHSKCTCALTWGHVPTRTALAWAESSAGSYANSVLGRDQPRGRPQRTGGSDRRRWRATVFT
jgi:predicted aconitase